jgi:hypothetical protein
VNARTRELTLQVDAARRKRVSGHGPQLGKHLNHRDYDATSNSGKLYKPKPVSVQRWRDKGNCRYRITVPPIFAEQLLPALYVCELTDEGLLYRRVDSERTA